MRRIEKMDAVDTIQEVPRVQRRAALQITQFAIRPHQQGIVQPLEGGDRLQPLLQRAQLRFQPVHAVAQGRNGIRPRGSAGSSSRTASEYSGSWSKVLLHAGKYRRISEGSRVVSGGCVGVLEPSCGGEAIY